MKSLTEQPVVLSVHQASPGQYILRVADLKFRGLLVGVTKLLTDAENFVVITPADIKVFSVGSNGTPQVQEESAEPEVEVDEEMAKAIAEQEASPLPGESQPEVVAETPQGTKVVRRKRRAPAESAGHDEACARCTGTGTIKTLIGDGEASETPCPICQGRGVMRRYGAPRR